jgi:hypothetical protein
MAGSCEHVNEPWRCLRFEKFSDLRTYSMEQRPFSETKRYSARR